MSENTPTPWTYRKMKTHFVIEAKNGVRVAEVRFIGRPDGSTSEDETKRIVEAVNRLAEEEGVLKRQRLFDEP